MPETTDRISSPQVNAMALIVTAKKQIAAFDRKCDRDQYLDVGDVWQTFAHVTTTLKAAIKALNTPVPPIEIIVCADGGLVRSVYSTDANVKAFIAADDDFECCIDKQGRRRDDCDKGEHTEADVDAYVALTNRTLTMTEVY